MQSNAVVNDAPPVPVAQMNGKLCGISEAPLAGQERSRELMAALEVPFEMSEIKWRVTNSSQIGSNGKARFRGQMLAYADPRAYTDRLNSLFTPSGWTRDYSVQLVQNFERKERGSAERTIAAKIVVTCKVTIYGFAAHTGLGEEWADSDNAGTAAEAQAFKRACSCFGLGRYLYDLGGQWVDLDEKKRPLETPRLPVWALPKLEQPAKQNGKSHQNGNGRGGLYRDELLSKVTALCETVGSGLAVSVLKTVAGVEEPGKIRDMARLTTVFEKLQDLEHGVERLRAAIAKCGVDRYAALCTEINLPGTSIDDIPDRTTLRNLLGVLEAEPSQSHQQESRRDLGELRGQLLREAARVGAATNRTLGDVILQAANGAFTLATLKDLKEPDTEKVVAALGSLKEMCVTPE